MGYFLALYFHPIENNKGYGDVGVGEGSGSFPSPPLLRPQASLLRGTWEQMAGSALCLLPQIQQELTLLPVSGEKEQMYCSLLHSFCSYHSTKTDGSLQPFCC